MNATEGSRGALTCVIIEADLYAALRALLDDIQLAIDQLIAASLALEDGLKSLPQAETQDDEPGE